MEDLRSEIGYVPQKGVLFSGTIASNLRYGKDDATDAQIEEAASIAQATEFIDTRVQNMTVLLHRAVLTCQVVRSRDSLCESHCKGS